MGSGHTISGDEGTAAAEWLRLTSGVLRGLTHAFGNRVHAFEMTLSAMAPGEQLTEEMVTLLGAESAACAELVRLYRFMNLAIDADAEACRVPDLVPDAVVLWGHHMANDGKSWSVSVHGEPPAVLAPPSALTQGLLMLLLAHTATDDASGTPLTLQVRGDDGWLVAEFSSAAISAPVPASIAAVQWLLRAAHATVSQSVSGDRATTELRLASLATARKLDRAQATEVR